MIFWPSIRMPGLIASNRPEYADHTDAEVTCKECGCVVRVMCKWLEEAGTLTCACGGEMMEDAVEELEVSSGVAR